MPGYTKIGTKSVHLSGSPAKSLVDRSTWAMDDPQLKQLERPPLSGAPPC